MCAISREVEEIGIEGLIIVLLPVLDYGPVTIMSLNHKKISWFNIGSQGIECFLLCEMLHFNWEQW